MTLRCLSEGYSGYDPVLGRPIRVKRGDLFFCADNTGELLLTTFPERFERARLAPYDSVMDKNEAMHQADLVAKAAAREREVSATVGDQSQ